MFPTPPDTENNDAEPNWVHAPPMSAEPQPLATVRPNASRASGPVGSGGVWVVTSLATTPVSPSLSVTVRVTVKVLAVA